MFRRILFLLLVVGSFPLNVPLSAVLLFAVTIGFEIFAMAPLALNGGLNTHLFSRCFRRTKRMLAGPLSSGASSLNVDLRSAPPAPSSTKKEHLLALRGFRPRFWHTPARTPLTQLDTIVSSNAAS